MDGLPPEVLAKIQAQKEKLQREFEEYARKQLESKINDIVAATGIAKEEAECALNLCANDELDAINRLATEPAFKERVMDMTHGNAAKGGVDDEEGYEGDDVDSVESAGRTRRSSKRRRKSAKVEPQNTVEKAPRIHMEGYNADGTPRAPTIRLGDALKRLEQIRRAAEAAKKQSASPSPAEKSSPQQVLTPQKAETSEEEKTDAISASSAEKSGARKSPRAKQPVSPAKSSTPVTSPKKSSSSPSKKINSTPSGQQQQTKSEDDYTYEDLKSLEWSDARIKAFLGRKSNPNAYYYRFNALGEEQRTGAWSDEEHKNFMDLIKNGVDYHWGIFSMKTPGRVGYQCSNYYRKLIADGVVVDPNYEVGEDGKLTFRKGGIKRLRTPSATAISSGKKVAAASPSVQPTITENPPPRKPRESSSQRRSSSSGRRRRHRNHPDDETSEEEVDDYLVVDESALQGKEFLLGDFKDAMTFKPMVQPAISPYGHVLDYPTWLRILRQSPVNTCPFTKQKVTRRDLIKLTKENIEEYRSKIVDVSFANPKTTTKTALVQEVVASSPSSIEMASDATAPEGVLEGEKQALVDATVS